MRPNPWAVTLVYVVGLTSPEAVTCEISVSCGEILAVCTVTTPLLAWFTLKSTIPPRTTAAPTPIATFCQVFMEIPLGLPARIARASTLAFLFAFYLHYAPRSRNVSAKRPKALAKALACPTCAQQFPRSATFSRLGTRHTQAVLGQRICAPYFRYK